MNTCQEAGRGPWRRRPAVRLQNKSHIGVTGGQHRGKPRGLGLAPFAFAGLFKVPVIAHFLERAFAIYLFLQPAQRLVHRLAFFQSYFGQKISLPFQVGAGSCRPRALSGFMAGYDACTPRRCQPAKYRKKQAPDGSWKGLTYISYYWQITGVRGEVPVAIQPQSVHPAHRAAPMSCAPESRVPSRVPSVPFIPSLPSD